MRRDGQEDEDAINLREYWHILLRRKWTIITVLVVSLLVSLIATFNTTPVYRSTSQARNFVECMRTRKPTINPLETAIRFAKVDPDTSRPDDHVWEASMVFNWFFAGHNNKLTVDTSWLKNTLPFGLFEDSGWRIRGQWDVQF